MKSFLFLNGQVRALQSKLLTVSQLDRMIGAHSPEDAFRVLVELQYAEYFDDSTTPSDFLKIIERGLLETKELILKGSGNDPAFEFIWKSFDLNNLKRALKRRLIEEKSDLGEFTEENGFSDLGTLKEEDLQRVVFDEKEAENLPEEYSTVLREAAEIFKKSESFREVEFAFDRAHFDFLARVAQEENSSFLRDLLGFLADSTNVRSLARSVLVINEKLPKAGFVPHGTFTFELIQDIENFAGLMDFIRRTRFATLYSGVDESFSPEEKLLSLERKLDRAYQDFLHESQSGEISSIQVPLMYFERRLQNARLLKFIMFAKFYGLDPETIYKTLEHF